MLASQYILLERAAFYSRTREREKERSDVKGAKIYAAFCVCARRVFSAGLKEAHKTPYKNLKVKDKICPSRKTYKNDLCRENSLGNSK